MDNNKKNVIVVVCVIVMTLVFIICAYGVYNRLLKYDGDNILNNNGNKVEFDDKKHEEQLLALGLSMYRHAESSIYFLNLSDGIIYNYDEVAVSFTDGYISEAQKDSSKYHVCWPLKKGDNYYANDYCGFGGDSLYTYKSIEIKEYNDSKIVYTVSYDVSYAGSDETDIKQQNFELVLQDGMWKINSFYGLPVEFN